MKRENFTTSLPINLVKRISHLKKVLGNNFVIQNEVAKVLYSFVLKIENENGIDKDDYKNDALTDMKCPECNGLMILRKGQKGKFYGCQNYPDCKHTENIK